MTPIADPKVSIDIGDIDDIDAVMEIMDEAFEPEYGEAWSKSQCSGILVQKGVWVSIAREDGEPVGFGLARMIADESELLLIGVRPHFRNRGYGKQLLDHVCATAQRHGAIKLHLEMREGNRAQQLYRSRGFEPVGRRKRYYRGNDGDRFDAITWSLILERN